jgi:hypothetical protein
MHGIMKRRSIVFLVPALLLVESAIVAQSESAAVPPKTEYGAREIGGTWERYPTQFAGFGSDPNAPPVPQPVPAPPLKPEYYGPWRAAQDEAAALSRAGIPPATNYTHCIGEGMPGMMQGMFPMEVLDTGDQVTIIQEAYNQVRRIYVGEEPPPPEDAEPRFAGHSGARWEGDTLVVETTGIKEYVGFRNVPHSPNARITERIRLLPDGDYMQNEITVTDPEYLTEPWAWTWMYKRWPGYKMQEYVCEKNLWSADEAGAATLTIDDLGQD